MKKTTTLLLVLLLVFSISLMAGCGGKSEPEVTGTIVEFFDFTVLLPDGWEDGSMGNSFSQFRHPESGFVTVQFNELGMVENELATPLSFDIGGYKWEGYETFGVSMFQAKVDGSDDWCVVQANGCDPKDKDVIAIIASIRAKE